MTSLTFPSASYGRNTDSPEAAVDQYQVLFQSADFPATARKGLEQLAASVQWAGGGPEDRYGECYALWPLSEQRNGVLVARLIDAGRDRLRRPHALRMDVVYVEPSELTTSPSQMSSLVTAAAWPSEPWGGPPEGIRLSPDRPDLAVAAVLKQSVSKGRGLPRVFVAHHPYFRASGFDVVFDPDAPAGRSSPEPISGHSRPTKPLLDQNGALRPPSRRTLAVPMIGLIAMFCGFGAAGWWGYQRYKQLQVDVSHLQQQLNATERKLDTEKSYHLTTIAALKESQRDLESQRREVVRLAASREELDALLRDFELVTVSNLRARLQAVEDAKGKSSELQTLERLRQADYVVIRCSEEIGRLIESLREAQRSLNQYRTREQEGLNAPPASARPSQPQKSPPAASRLHNE